MDWLYLLAVQGTLKSLLQHHSSKVSIWRSAFFICMCVLCAQSCLTLRDPMDCSLPGSSVHGILQSRILEWASMPSSKGSSQPRDRTRISCGSCIAGKFFTAEPPGKPGWGLSSLFFPPTWAFHFFPDLKTWVGFTNSELLANSKPQLLHP